MGIALLFFATAVRNLLRSGEAREATYSSVAYGGWMVVVAGLSQMVMWNWGLINGAADARDDAALHTLSYVAYFGWAGMGIGLATAFIATGSGRHAQRRAARGGSRSSPSCSGVLGALGNAGIPPGGLGHLRAASVLADRRLVRHRQEPATRHHTSPACRGQGLVSSGPIPVLAGTVPRTPRKATPSESQ